MTLSNLTQSQYAEWLTAASRDGVIEDGGVTVLPDADPDTLPKIGDLLDHPGSERVLEIVGFRVGNATLQVCPTGRGLVTVAVVERKDAGTVYDSDPLRLHIQFGADQ